MLLVSEAERLNFMFLPIFGELKNLKPHLPAN